MPAPRDGVRPAQIADLVDNVSDRLTDRERRTSSTETGRVPFAYVWTFAGALTTGLLPIPPLWHTGRLAVVRFLPNPTPGSTSTTLNVQRNGTALTPLNAGSTTITLTASVSDETSVMFGLDAHIFTRIGTQAADQPGIEILTVGTGAVGLTILADFI